jgi:hypothetical protein
MMGMRSQCRPLIAAVLLATAVSAAAGCGRPPEPTTSDGPGVDPATAARVTGRVEFDGERPPIEMVRLDADRQCVAAAGGAVQPSSALLLGREGGLENAFVHVSRGLERQRFPIPTEPVVIDQQRCHYVPRVTGVRVGQALEIRNGDPLLHNVRSSSAINQPFNQGQPVQGMVFSHTFTTREVMVPLGCDVHGWMQAFIGAIEHPYFAVTGPDGAFSLPELPPGTYTLEAWHEQLGTRTTEVTLGPGESDDVVFTFAR